MTEAEQTVDLRWGALWRDGHLQKFMVLAFGIWLHAANSTLTATLIPSAVMEIGGIAFLSWTMVLYQVGSIVAAAGIGLLAMRFGLRSSMMVAAGLYGVGCAVAAAAPEMWILLIGRLAQGAGGGALVALTHVAVARIFPSAMMPRMMALMSALWGVSAFCGPAVGGFFAEVYTWRAGFWAFAVQAFLYLLALIFLVPKGARPEIEEGARLPRIRLAILAAAILSVASGGVLGFSWIGLGLGVLGMALLWAFFDRDRRSAKDRLFPYSAYQRGSATQSGMLMMALLFFGSIAFSVYGPLLAQLIYGIGPLQSGFLIALESVSWSVSAVLFSGLAPKHHNRVIRLGAVLVVIFVLGMAFAIGQGPIWWLFPFLIVGGAGFGISYGYVIQRIVAGAAEEDRSRASSSVPTSQMMSYALGAASCGFLANGLGLSDFSTAEEATRIAFWLVIGFLPVALLGTIAAFAMTRRNPQAQIEPS